MSQEVFMLVPLGM